MRTLFVIALAIVTFTSCKHVPDLTVVSVVKNPGWASGTHTVDVTIKNIGNGDAGSFLLYVDAHNSSPTVGQISSQATKDYPSLAAGASDIFHVDFDSNPFVEGHSIADVISILATVDSKDMVKESNEGNNTGTVNVP